MKCYGLYLVAILGLFPLMNCKHADTVNTKMVYPADISFTENPAAYWQAGYSVSDTPDPSSFILCTFADTARSIPLWHPDRSNGYPYIGQNKTQQSIQDASGRWALRKGQLAMEASNTGQYSMLRFVTPAADTYHIKVVFEGVHYGLSTTDVHVLLNAKELFTDIIDGYGGDPAFHAVEGLHPATSFETTIWLEKNDILTFAVGYGNNKTHFNDTTGLQIIIERI